MFMSLDEKDLNIVIDAMDKRNTKPNDYIIKEGEDGDVLYIVESGDLKCTKVINGVETYLKNYQ